MVSFFFFFKDSLSHSKSVPAVNIADLYRTCKFDGGTRCVFHCNKAEFIRLVGHTFVADAGQEPAVKNASFQSFVRHILLKVSRCQDLRRCRFRHPALAHN